MASVFKRDKKTKGSKFIASWYDAEHEVWRQTVAYTDRGLSFALAQRLEHESASRREGFTSKVRDQSIRQIAEQVDEYITDVVSDGGDPNYVSQLRRRIERTLDAIKSEAFARHRARPCANGIVADAEGSWIREAGRAAGGHYPQRISE